MRLLNSQALMEGTKLALYHINEATLVRSQLKHNHHCIHFIDPLV